MGFIIGIQGSKLLLSVKYHVREKIMFAAHNGKHVKNDDENYLGC